MSAYTIRCINLAVMGDMTVFHPGQYVKAKHIAGDSYDNFKPTKYEEATVFPSKEVADHVAGVFDKEVVAGNHKTFAEVEQILVLQPRPPGTETYRGVEITEDDQEVVQQCRHFVTKVMYQLNSVAADLQGDNLLPGARKELQELRDTLKGFMKRNRFVTFQTRLAANVLAEERLAWIANPEAREANGWVLHEGVWHKWVETFVLVMDPKTGPKLKKGTDV